MSFHITHFPSEIECQAPIHNDGKHSSHKHPHSPPTQVYSGSGQLRGNRSELYWDIYLRPLLLAFGEYRYDSLAGCLEGDAAAADQDCPHPRGLKAYTGGLMHVYLIIVNLLLMNLLIAKFSLTVAVKDEHVNWGSVEDCIILAFSLVV